MPVKLNAYSYKSYEKTLIWPVYKTVYTLVESLKEKCRSALFKPGSFNATLILPLPLWLYLLCRRRCSATSFYYKLYKIFN